MDRRKRAGALAALFVGTILVQAAAMVLAKPRKKK